MIIRACLGLPLIFVLANCSSESKIQNMSECDPVIGVESILDEASPKYIVVGEVHGMTAPPKLVEALICHSLNAGFKTSLALELADDESYLSTYLSSDGSDAAKEALFKDQMWRDTFTDGRSSEAMLDLIDYGRIQSTAKELSVFGFMAPPTDMSKFEGTDDAARNYRSQVYERTMAENIVKKSEDFGSEKVIVLTGNLHARHSRYNRGEISYDLMGVHLPAGVTLTLNAIYTAGSSWSCRGAAPEDCKAHKSGGSVAESDALAQSEVFQLFLWSDESSASYISTYSNPKNYDGVVYVGRAQASAPANLKGRK